MRNMIKISSKFPSMENHFQRTKKTIATNKDQKTFATDKDQKAGTLLPRRDVANEFKSKLSAKYDGKKDKEEGCIKCS